MKIADSLKDQYFFGSRVNSAFSQSRRWKLCSRGYFSIKKIAKGLILLFDISLFAKRIKSWTCLAEESQNPFCNRVAENNEKNPKANPTQ